MDQAADRDLAAIPQAEQRTQYSLDSEQVGISILSHGQFDDDLWDILTLDDAELVRRLLTKKEDAPECAEWAGLFRLAGYKVELKNLRRGNPEMAASCLKGETSDILERFRKLVADKAAVVRLVDEKQSKITECTSLVKQAQTTEEREDYFRRQGVVLAANLACGRRTAGKQVLRQSYMREFFGWSKYPPCKFTSPVPDGFFTNLMERPPNAEKADGG